MRRDLCLDEEFERKKEQREERSAHGGGKVSGRNVDVAEGTTRGEKGKREAILCMYKDPWTGLAGRAQRRESCVH